MAYDAPRHCRDAPRVSRLRNLGLACRFIISSALGGWQAPGPGNAGPGCESPEPQAGSRSEAAPGGSLGPGRGPVKGLPGGGRRQLRLWWGPGPGGAA